MFYEIFMRVGIDPNTEDDLFAKYDADDRWKIVKGEHGKIVFECEVPRYESELPPELLYN